jgi:hypothetical protein
LYVHEFGFSLKNLYAGVHSVQHRHQCTAKDGQGNIAVSFNKHLNEKAFRAR